MTLTALSTQLVEAARVGDLVAVKAYLDQGADPADNDSHALLEAVMGEHLTVVQHLVTVAPVDVPDRAIGVHAMGALNPAIGAAILPRVDRRATLVAYANDMDVRDGGNAFQALRQGAEILAPYLSAEELQAWQADAMLRKLPAVKDAYRATQRAAALATRPAPAARSRVRS